MPGELAVGDGDRDGGRPPSVPHFAVASGVHVVRRRIEHWPVTCHRSRCVSAGSARSRQDRRDGLAVLVWYGARSRAGEAPCGAVGGHGQGAGIGCSGSARRSAATDVDGEAAEANRGAASEDDEDRGDAAVVSLCQPPHRMVPVSVMSSSVKGAGDEGGRRSRVAHGHGRCWSYAGAGTVMGVPRSGIGRRGSGRRPPACRVPGAGRRPRPWLLKKAPSTTTKSEGMSRNGTTRTSSSATTPRSSRWGGVSGAWGGPRRGQGGGCPPPESDQTGTVELTCRPASSAGAPKAVHRAPRATTSAGSDDDVLDGDDAILVGGLDGLRGELLNEVQHLDLLLGCSPIPAYRGG